MRKIQKIVNTFSMATMMTPEHPKTIVIDDDSSETHQSASMSFGESIKAQQPGDDNLKASDDRSNPIASASKTGTAKEKANVNPGFLDRFETLMASRLPSLARGRHLSTRVRMRIAVSPPAQIIYQIRSSLLSRHQPSEAAHAREPATVSRPRPNLHHAPVLSRRPRLL